MQFLSIIELFYASYTDIRYMETNPFLITACIAARILELMARGQDFLSRIIVTAIVFTVFLAGCAIFSIGGADALIAALICISLGLSGTYAVVTGLILAFLYGLITRQQEIALIPFLSTGYLIWLVIETSVMIGA